MIFGRKTNMLAILNLPLTPCLSGIIFRDSSEEQGLRFGDVSPPPTKKITETMGGNGKMDPFWRSFVGIDGIDWSQRAGLSRLWFFSLMQLGWVTPNPKRSTVEYTKPIGISHWFFWGCKAQHSKDPNSKPWWSLCFFFQFWTCLERVTSFFFFKFAISLFPSYLPSLNLKTNIAHENHHLS